MRIIYSFCGTLLLAFSLSWGGEVFAQNLLNDNIQLSGGSLDLRTYVSDLGGGSQLISMTDQPGSPNIFVVNQFGQVFSVSDNGSGRGIATVWFDYDDAINQARTDAGNGYELSDPGRTHGGLRSVAFHPEFETNGKFYTSAMVDRPSNRTGIGSDFNYLGNSASGFDAESVVAEWTVDANGDVDASSYRELFRIRMPVFDHPVKQMVFNKFAQPGDEDYGLLYIAHGDGSTQSTSAGDGLNPLDGLGKILRVNPLEEVIVSNPPVPPPANPTQIVTGFDQRYIGADYNPVTGTLADASGNGQTATEVGGGFSFTTTPNGNAAVRNSDAAGDGGVRLQFTRNATLGGTSGFTIQAVFSGNSNPSGDGSSGIYGLQPTTSFSGVFLGAGPAGSIDLEIRGGNVDSARGAPGAFLNDGAVPNTAAVDQFAIYTLVVDPTASAGNVFTATIIDPLTGTVLASTSLGNPGSAIEGLGNIGALFAGEDGAPGSLFDRSDNFNGAIADLVVYNTALSAAELAQNNAFFTETYFEGSVPRQPQPYTTPNNPFINDPRTLNEIYSLGHRNPHHISFAEAADGSTHLIAAETGRDNVEEVNVIQAGANYGWGLREGTFVHESSGGYINGVSALPDNEAENGFTYPSAQFDHDTSAGRGFIGFVIGGGFVIDNNSDPDLQGEYIFCDFGFHHGFVYHVNFEELLDAKTTLEIGELPSELTQAEISRLTITIDTNGDGTVDQAADNLVDLFGGRNDFRFGRGPNGEMFITSKQSRDLYIVTNTISTGCLLGDVDRSKFVSFLDIPPFIDVLAAGDFQCEADCDESGQVDFADIPAFISILAGQ